MSSSSRYAAQIGGNNEEDNQELSKHFKPLNISSSEALHTEIQRIGPNLISLDTNWKVRVECIQQIGHILRGNILHNPSLCQQFIDELLLGYRDAICKQIEELRSGVIKEICRVLSYLAVLIDEESERQLTLKSAIEPFIDYILPSILKQLKQSILAISHCTNITVRTILKRLPVGSKSIQHLLNNADASQQKTVCLRVRCMEFVQILIEVQPYHAHYLLQRHDAMAQFVQCVTRNIADPHPSVRFVARQCVWSMDAVYPAPKYWQHVVAHISPQNVKYVMADKAVFQMFAAPIGTGHRIELGGQQHRKNNNHNQLQINNNNHEDERQEQQPHQKQPQRPKSALPSKKHRLELLKKRKRLHLNKKFQAHSNDDVILLPQRPRTAHPPLAVAVADNHNSGSNGSNGGSAQVVQIGEPLRIAAASYHDDDVLMNDDGDAHGDENNSSFGNTHAHSHHSHQRRAQTRKISIMGNATRFCGAEQQPLPTKMQTQPQSPAAHPHPKLPPAMRVETNQTMPNHAPSNVNQHVATAQNLRDILGLIQKFKINGVQFLSEWLQNNAAQELDDDAMSMIVFSLTGFVDCVSMNKRNTRNEEDNDGIDLYMTPLIRCVHNLIAYGAQWLSVSHFIRAFGKILTLLIACDCNEYQRRYTQNTAYLKSIVDAFIAAADGGGDTKFCLANLIAQLSKTILKTKQKVAWLHFISCYARQQPQSQVNDDDDDRDSAQEMFSYLLHLLKECVLSTALIEYHVLFRLPTCTIVEDALQCVMSVAHAIGQESLLQSQLNQGTIETLLGLTHSQSVKCALQRYYSLLTTTTQNGQSQIDGDPQVQVQPQTQKRQPSVSVSAFTTPSQQNKTYQRIRKIQIDTCTTPPLNMYMSTPALNSSRKQSQPPSQPRSQPIQKEKIENMQDLSNEQLIETLLHRNRGHFTNEKDMLKLLAHRMSTKQNEALFHRHSEAILAYVLKILNSTRFNLHRNGLRIFQALCWFYAQCISQQLPTALQCVVNLFGKNVPPESGELALDVINPLCKTVHYEQCLKHLMPMIAHLIDEARDQPSMAEDNGRKIFGALCIFDRTVVLAPTEWLRTHVDNLAKLLIYGYRYFREPMRSLIYLCIILDGDASFLNQHKKEQKIVKIMCTESDFTDWIKSHRMQKN